MKKFITMDRGDIELGREMSLGGRQLLEKSESGHHQQRKALIV